MKVSVRKHSRRLSHPKKDAYGFTHTKTTVKKHHRLLSGKSADKAVLVVDKNMTTAELKHSDFDGDGVKNFMDCRPFDKAKQDLSQPHFKLVTNDDDDLTRRVKRMLYEVFGELSNREFVVQKQSGTFERFWFDDEGMDGIWEIDYKNKTVTIIEDSEGTKNDKMSFKKFLKIWSYER